MASSAEVQGLRVFGNNCTDSPHDDGELVPLFGLFKCTEPCGDPAVVQDQLTQAAKILAYGV